MCLDSRCSIFGSILAEGLRSLRRCTVTVEGAVSDDILVVVASFLFVFALCCFPR